MLKPDVHTALALLLVTAFALPWQPLGILAAIALLVASLAVSSSRMRQAAGRAIRRMRWLLISLLVLSLFLTPGEPVFADHAALSPSWNGVTLMLERGLLLLALALLATIFLAHYTAAEIVSAMQRMLFFLPGRLAERLALRIFLVLDELPHVEEKIRQLRSDENNKFMPAAVGVISRIESMPVAQPQAMLDDESKAAEVAHVPDRPGLSSWLAPLLLLGIFILTAQELF